MYLPVLVFDLVTICGEGDESLETHHVFPLDPGALSTFASLNSRDALDHSDCSSPSESVLLMNMYGTDRILPDSATFGDSFNKDVEVIEASLECNVEWKEFTASTLST